MSTLFICTSYIFRSYDKFSRPVLMETDVIYLNISVNLFNLYHVVSFEVEIQNSRKKSGSSQRSFRVLCWVRVGELINSQNIYQPIFQVLVRFLRVLEQKRVQWNMDQNEGKFFTFLKRVFKQFFLGKIRVDARHSRFDKVRSSIYSVKRQVVWKNFSMKTMLLLDDNDRYVDIRYDGYVQQSYYGLFVNACKIKVW